MDLSPGGDVILRQKETPLDLSKCVICQKFKDKNGDKKLTSTEKGRNTLIESSEVLQDELSKNLDEDQIKYHVNNCYSR